MRKLSMVCLIFIFALGFAGKRQDTETFVPEVTDRYSAPSNYQPVVEPKTPSPSDQFDGPSTGAVNPDDYPVLRFGPDIMIFNGTVNYDSWAALNNIEDEAISVDYHRGDTLIAAVATNDSIKAFKSYDNGQTWHYVRWFRDSGYSLVEPEIIWGSNGLWYHMVARSTRNNGDITCFNIEGDESGSNQHWIENTTDTVRNFTLCSDKADNLTNYYLFLAFHKGLGGNFADGVFFSRSTDRGVTWSGPTQILYNGAGFPDLDDGDGDTYLAFYGRQSTNKDIGVIKSTDNGVSWSPATLVQSDTTTKITPKVAVSHDGSDDAWVIWPRRWPADNHDFDLRYSWTTNGGTNWSGSAFAVSYVDSSELLPDMAVYDGYNSTSRTPYVTYLNILYDYTGQVNVKMFNWNDSDSSWGDPIAFNDNGATLTKPVQTWETADVPALAYVGASGQNVYFDSWSNVGVKENENSVTHNELSATVRPNPFSVSTSIEYTLPVSGQVKVQAYNTLGQEVATIFDGVQTSGSHKLSWSGIDNLGRRLPNGIYLLKIKAENIEATKKVIIE